jgi:hypothetical protein
MVTEADRRHEGAHQGRGHEEKEKGSRGDTDGSTANGSSQGASFAFGNSEAVVVYYIEVAVREVIDKMLIQWRPS